MQRVAGAPTGPGMAVVCAVGTGAATGATGATGAATVGATTGTTTVGLGTPIVDRMIRFPAPFTEATTVLERRRVSRSIGRGGTHF